MSKIRLITLKGKTHDQQDIEISTLQYIMIALNRSNEKGYTIEEMLDRSRVDRALDNVKPEDTELELSEKNFETLKKAVEEVKWTGRNPVISDLIIDLFEAADKESAAPAYTDELKKPKKLKAVKD